MRINDVFGGGLGNVFSSFGQSGGVAEPTLPVFDGVSYYAWERETALGSPDLTSWPGANATLTPVSPTKAPQVLTTNVKWDGVDDVAKTGSLTWSSTYHVFAVCNNGTGAAGATNVIISSEATSNALRWYYNRGAVRIDATIWLTNAATVVPTSTMPSGGEGTVALFEVDVNATTARLRTNGVAGSDVNLAVAARSTSQVLHVGGRTDTPSDPSAIGLRALVIYMADITDPQAQEVRDYLTAKYLI